MSDRSPRDRVRTLLMLLAAAALVWAVYEGWALARFGQPLDTPTAPRRFISLALASTPSQQRAVIRDWSCEASPRDPCQNVIPVAREALTLETRLVIAYVLAGFLLSAWAARVTRVRLLALMVIGLLLGTGALLDLGENRLLTRLLTEPPEFAAVATLVRVAAMSKFVVLLFGFGTMLAVVGGALRLVKVWRVIERFASDAGKTPITSRTFEDLIEKETEGIFGPTSVRATDPPQLDLHVPADEPHVIFYANDLVGLSLSGGGIRSATFNLGLLQGLQRLHLLAIFDYVSTVSGGGYIGSFWSEWLVREQQRVRTEAWAAGDAAHDTKRVPEPRLFPTRRNTGAAPQSQVDTDQERHLREFSGFLAPRWGFFEVETWTAIVAALSGLIPALLIGLSVIGAGLIAWLALTFPLASPRDLSPVPFVVIVTMAALIVFERMWTEFKRESAGTAHEPEPSATKTVTTLGTHLWARLTGTARRTKPRPLPAAVIRRVSYWVSAAFAVILAGLLQFLVPRTYDALFGFSIPIYHRVLDGVWRQVAGESGVARWWVVSGIDNAGGGWVFSPRLFDFGLCWLTVALLLILLRMAYSVWPWHWSLESLAAFDRVIQRVLGLGVFWCGITVLWHVAINSRALAATVTAAVVSAGTFAALRNWIGITLRRPSGAGMLDRLRPYLPPLLAYLAIGLGSVALAGLLIRFCGTDWWLWWETTSVMAIFLLLGLFIKADEFGLHAFYRDRISRAYAGASNLLEKQDATTNRGTEPREGDSRKLTELVDRPLHLVCCAANDLSGDEVETLGRGARSAVLSKHGFSLGRYFHPWTPVTVQKLGAAVTASAAAFNSNMGQLSQRLGPAVSFLMTALNLRLGLWLRHPGAPQAQPRRWPGLLFYREMFGLTSASGSVGHRKDLPKTLRDVHLSDGGHFENLAVYELIRRHCRYVLMSDCGADPTVAFDDLGNALRRIREDFGVDITLDVSPLRPGPDGRSKQHIAVGTIHYSPTDRGILLYVKPTITGDEPPDVLQYRTRNASFPHEGTGDQFYDEAQWESYRRLGLHAAECLFEFVRTQDDAASSRTADRVFAEAKNRWSPTPEGLEDRVLEMTKRFGELEAELQLRPARGILKQVFPELASLPKDLRSGYEEAHWRRPAQGAPAEDPRAAAPPLDPGAATASDLSFLLRVTQLMEDAWLTCDLDTWWAHPLNLGWINLFARWATAPTFRFWWPVMAPMFSPGFRRFIEQRFPMPAEQVIDLVVAGRLEPLPRPEGSGLAALWWAERSAQPRNWGQQQASADNDQVSRALYQRLIDLRRPDGPPVPIQVGILAVTTRELVAGWTSDDFFVPPSLWGAGMGGVFLDQILARLSAAGLTHCYAIVKPPPADRRNQVAVDDRRSFVEHYRKAGFRQRLTTSGAGPPLDRVLCTVLGLHEKEDTLLVLDLAEWKTAAEGRAGPDA